MCVPILRSIGSELTKLENMQQLYILYDVTWRKNGTSYVIFIGAILYMLYSIGPINVCTDFEINRYKIDEVRK